MSKADAPEPATMVAVRGRETDSCEIAAPLGLDVYLGGIRPSGMRCVRNLSRFKQRLFVCVY